MVVIKAKGFARGICVMWRVGLSPQKVEFNKNLIIVKVSGPICDWMLIRFYGLPYLAKKRKAWENLMDLIGSHDGPWMRLGDFNFTINDEEISGSRKGSSSATNYLKELIFEFGAINLGYSSNKFTWARGRWGNSTIKRRLDRGIANISWRLTFPKASISHLGVIISNHAPILLDTNP